MSRRDEYPPGVPCFVDTLVSDLRSCQRFYGGVFGWEFVGPGQIPGDPPGTYFVARLGGVDVAGLGQAPAGQSPPVGWNTHVSVASADDAVQAAREAGGSVLASPVDVLPAGRMAVIADPAGAALCLWEPAERRGAGRINEPSAWAMSALGTDDPAAASEFYGELFGWQTEPFGDERAGPWLFRLPGFVGGEPHQPVPRDVVAVMIAGESPSRWTVDFWIDDAERAAATASELGGTVVAAPFEDGGFRRTLLRDPDGASFGVSQLLSA